MARRFAIVVGVRNYRSFTPLAAAQLDAEMMAHVLREVAGFDDVRLLLDPDQLQLAEAIESLFAGRERDDLTLFYFSGHGIKDERGFLHFGVPDTRRRANGELVRSSAVSCRHVHDAMAVSRARRQVVILDCCFSAAFAEGMLAKDAGNLDLRAQLGGQGRAVLASSSSTEFSFDTSETGLSMYTQYLVHGLNTGEADLNHDGMITADELHEYAKSRVRAEKPAMSPQILPSREGYSIVIAPARQVDPRRAYAAKVREVADVSGSISEVAARVLALHQQQLGIARDDARQIEEAELGSRRSRASSVKLLREAVYDARSRGQVDAERALLNELRVASNLTETDLSDLIQQPIDAQRRDVLGWRYWPRRLVRVGGTAVVLCLALIVALRVAAMIGDDDSGQKEPDNDLIEPEPPPGEDSPGRTSPEVDPPDTTDPVPPNRDDSEWPEEDELPAVTIVNPDITGTSYVLRLASKKSFSDAARLLEIAADSSLGGVRLRPQLVIKGGLYRLLVGPYSRWEAEQLHSEARMLLYDRGVEAKPGAVVQNMSTWCPRLSVLQRGVRYCLR